MHPPSMDLVSNMDNNLFPQDIQNHIVFPFDSDEYILHSSLSVSARKEEINALSKDKVTIRKVM